MATLNNLTNLIANAKSTTSGKIEWTDTSLKGIQQEVEYLFSQNAIQVVNNTNTLQSTINDNSQLAFVTSDGTLANNGIYYWSLTQESTINFPAGSNGFWNLIEFGVTSAIGAGYIPYSNGTNFLPSWLKQTVDEIKMMGGSFVANRSTTTGPYFQAGDTDSVGNDIIFTIDDKNQVINSKKATANKGIKLDFANNIHKIGDIDANKGLSVDTANSVYKLGNTSASEGVVINLNNGYIGNPTWGYVYNATTLYAGNASINLTLNDSTNIATLGDGTNGLSVNPSGTYKLGNSIKGLDIDTNANTYLLGHNSVGYGLSISAPFSVSLGDTANGNGLIIDNANETYILANSVLGKGLFIDSTAETYKLGTYAGYGLSLTATTGYLGTSTLNHRYTATTVSVGTASILLNIDTTSGFVSLGAPTRGVSMLITGANPTYSFGNLISQIGVFLGQTTGYLGNPTFGYNYTATTMIAGNSSINLTLNDTSNVGTLGSTSYGFIANMSTSVLNAGTTAYGLMVDLPNSKIQLNGNGYGLEVLGLGNIVRTFNGTTTEGLYIDLFGSNYSLGGNAVGLNIANTGKTLQTYLNAGSTGAEINGLNFSYTGDTYLLGGEYATKSAAIGVKGSRTATPQVQVGSDLVVAAAVAGTQLEKIRVFIPGVGVRYIPVYLS